MRRHAGLAPGRALLLRVGQARRRALARPLRPGHPRRRAPPGAAPGTLPADTPQGLPARPGQLLGLLRERPRHPDRARRLPTGPRRLGGRRRRAGPRLLRILQRPRRRPARLRGRRRLRRDQGGRLAGGLSRRRARGPTVQGRGDHRFLGGFPLNSSALFTDFYELTMAQGYWKHGLDTSARNNFV